MRPLLLGLGLSLVPWVAQFASAQTPSGPRSLYSPSGVQAAPVIPASSTEVVKAPAKSVLDFVQERYRDTVSSIMKSPTISTKGTDDEFLAHPKIYDWLIEHPDRTSLAWQRLKVPCVEIEDLGKGVFKWTDENGSELTWQTVGRFDQGVIWYASGRIKAGTLIPSAPIKAVAILQSPRSVADQSGLSTFKPTVHLYLQSDSRVANMVLKIIGPSAPQIAQQGAEQLLYFFSGVARQIAKKPEQVETLLAPKK